MYPPPEEVFTAFELTPLSTIRVVVLGQDPYHGPGQAHGLSFSVPAGVTKLPPSLRNIVKESASALPEGADNTPKMGDLSAWAAQGVFLLNACLTVRRAAANSHSKQGWETFTDAAIAHIAKHTRDTAFLLWGKPAQKKGRLVSGSKHLVLTSPHPSPLSGACAGAPTPAHPHARTPPHTAAHRGFFGCGHFAKVNEHLHSLGLPGIDWTIQSLEAQQAAAEAEAAEAAAEEAAAAEGGGADAAASGGADPAA